MSNKRITDLTELTNPTTDDVLPIVDIATNTTQKVQVGNLPTTTAVTNALATKQDTLVSGTNIKTLNNQSLLGSGNIVLTANPSGVAGAIQFSNGSAFASDASNFFWDNTNKRLGVSTNAPSGKVHFITDDCTTPTSFSNQTSILAGTLTQALLAGYSSTNGAFLNALSPGVAWYKINYGALQHIFSNAGNVNAVIDSNTTFGNGTTSLGARLGIKGSGSTSATTSLLVQNSAGTQALKVSDNTYTQVTRLYLQDSNDFFYAPAGGPIVADGFHGFRVSRSTGSTQTMFEVSDLYNTTGGLMMNVKNQLFANMFAVNYLGQASMGTASPNASAQMQIDSTTRGFLPPRMTTTQKNAIATPASGLVVYDTTTNKLCCYNGSTWNDLF